MKYQCEQCHSPLYREGLCWQCRHELERAEVLSWTDEQIESKIAFLIANVEQLDDWDTEGYELYHELLEVHGIYSAALQRAAVEKKIISLATLYYKAPADVRDKLIALLDETMDRDEAADLMECVAMQGDDEALRMLVALERNPRPWRAKLYANPSIYAQVAGWTFDEEGNRQTLNYNTCYAMEKGDKRDDEAAIIGRAREDFCPHCQCQLVDLLVLDGTDERLQFLGIKGTMTASGCPNCCCFTNAAYNRFTVDGASTPIFPYKGLEENLENHIEEKEMTALIENRYVLGKHPVPLFYGAGDSCDLNTIGGFAAWVQDWEYIACPDCEKPMKYMAQIQWDSVMNGMEGTLYIEVCSDCSIAAMHHQQT